VRIPPAPNLSIGVLAYRHAGAGLGDLLRSKGRADVIGLRDRALISVMVFTFTRISAACDLNVGDIFHPQRRLSGCDSTRRAASSTIRWRGPRLNSNRLYNRREDRITLDEVVVTTTTRASRAWRGGWQPRQVYPGSLTVFHRQRLWRLLHDLD